MKNEQEFLASMWTQINAAEWEARQKLLVCRVNRRLFIRELFTYGMITALLAAAILFILLTQTRPDIISASAILFLTAIFYSESLSGQKNEGGIYR